MIQRIISTLLNLLGTPLLHPAAPSHQQPVAGFGDNQMQDRLEMLDVMCEVGVMIFCCVLRAERPGSVGVPDPVRHSGGLCEHILVVRVHAPLAAAARLPAGTNHFSNYLLHGPQPRTHWYTPDNHLCIVEGFPPTMSVTLELYSGYSSA